MINLVKEDMDLGLVLAETLKICIDTRLSMTIDEWCDLMGIAYEDRSDFMFASLMNQANKYLDEWGY